MLELGSIIVLSYVFFSLTVKMLPLKILKKQASYNILNACLKRPKEFHQAQGVAFGHENWGNHTIDAISSYWRHRFEREGVPQPMESVEHIVTHVLGDKEKLNDQKLSEIQMAKLEILCHQRLRLMPLEYVIGDDCKLKKMSLSMQIYIPERQTEMLVDLILKHVSRSCANVCTVLEIGCGVGAISLSLLRSCDSVQVVAIDTNVIACELTLYNAQNLELDDRLSILHATLEEDGSITFTKNLSHDSTIDLEEENFDFIISNPPYTPIDQIPEWQKELGDNAVHYGGKDGLKVIRPILEYASSRLKNRGVLLLEILRSQPEKIRSIIEEIYPSKLSIDHIYEDFCNNESIVEITKIE